MKFDLTVNDIKQYLYCKRIVFFNYLMPVEKKSTYKMEHGKLMEEKIEHLDQRRKLKRYNLNQGERIYHLLINSDRLGLSGKLDMLISSNGEYFPVDFKFTSGRPHKNHIYQLGGYALLVEEKFGVEVNKGFIYLIPKNDVFTISLTNEIKTDILKMLEDIRFMIKNEIMPDATRHRAKCIECEFRNYCGDVF